MARCRRLFALFVFIGALAAHAQQNVSGRWQGSFDVPGAGGAVQHDTAFLILRQNGAEVTGSAGRNEEMQEPVHDGVLHGNTLSFAMDVRGTTVRFALQLQGDHLRGTATGLPPDPAAKVAVDVARLPNPTIENLLQHFMGSVLVVRDGKVLGEQSFGSANLAWNVPNTSETRFHIGSITKQFTAVSVLMLADEGKLRLDDPVSKYIENSPETWKKITLLELLAHQSGIVSITDLPAEQAKLTRGGTPAQIVDRFRNQPLLFAPGTQARYSNSGYILLGMVVEKVSGEPYAGFLQKHIFDPLGMHDTGVDNGVDVVEDLASGYRMANGRLVRAEFVDMRIPIAAGDMYSTTGDLVRWEEGLYRGKLLRPDSLKKMTTPGMGDFGLGVMVKDEQGERVISHTGGIQGFVADLRYYPGRKLAVVVLSNTESKETLAVSQMMAEQARQGSVALGTPGSALRDGILAADRQLFDGYNTCNISEFSSRLSPTLEFFHDTTGLTNYEWNVNALEKRCAEKTKYHRTLDEQSVRVFPIPGYGAMEIGSHRFFETRPDASEQLDAAPGFANVWKQTPDGWKLTRVLSYGHR